MSHDFTQLYSNCDRALVDFIRLVRYKERPLLCVFATPERALAEVQKTIKRRTGDVTRPIKTIPLMFASISVDSGRLDLADRFAEAYYAKAFWNAKTEKFQKVKKPNPWFLEYQVTFWARNLRDLRSANEQLVTSLRANEIYLPVLYPDPFGYRRTRVTLQDVRDLSKREQSEKERLLRTVYVLGMHTWICGDVTEVGRVDSIGVEVYESDDMEVEGDLLDSYTVS